MVRARLLKTRNQHLNGSSSRHDHHNQQASHYSISPGSPQQVWPLEQHISDFYFSKLIMTQKATTDNGVRISLQARKSNTFIGEDLFALFREKANSKMISRRMAKFDFIFMDNTAGRYRNNSNPSEGSQDPSSHHHDVSLVPVGAVVP